jgi:hypothetical protein
VLLCVFPFLGLWVLVSLGPCWVVSVAMQCNGEGCWWGNRFGAMQPMGRRVVALFVWVWMTLMVGFVC